MVIAVLNWLRRSVATLLLASAPCWAAISVQDGTGHTVTLPQTAQRIITLAPHLTENLYAIGAGGQIVGTVDYSDYPASALKIPRVGGYSGFDLERIRALKPDLILAWQGGNPPQQLAKIAALGIPVYYDNVDRMADIPDVLLRLGTLTGHPSAAQTAAQDFRQRMDKLTARYAGRRPVRLFYQVWDRPLMTINGTQIISDAMRLCGAVNVFADLPALVPTIDNEAVLAANPDIIATSGEPGMQAAVMARWKQWPKLAATQNNQLIVLPPDILSRKGPRFVAGAEALCAAIDKAR